MLERADYVEGRGSSVSQKLRMAKKDYSREDWYFCDFERGEALPFIRGD